MRLASIEAHMSGNRRRELCELEVPVQADRALRWLPKATVSHVQWRINCLLALSRPANQRALKASLTIVLRTRPVRSLSALFIMLDYVYKLSCCSHRIFLLSYVLFLKHKYSRLPYCNNTSLHCKHCGVATATYCCWEALLKGAKNSSAAGVTLDTALMTSTTSSNDTEEARKRKLSVNQWQIKDKKTQCCIMEAS